MAGKGLSTLYLGPFPRLFLYLGLEPIKIPHPTPLGHAAAGQGVVLQLEERGTGPPRGSAMGTAGSTGEATLQSTRESPPQSRQLTAKLQPRQSPKDWGGGAPGGLRSLC